MKTKLFSAAVFAFLIFNFSFAAFAQGALTPPGAPAPTMRTLAQIEPRTPISSVPFNITQAGSYYLTTNLVSTNTTSGFVAIVIVNGVGDVTLDLNGFAIIDANSVGGVNQFGIVAGGNNANLVVRNGTLRNWSSGGIAFNPVNGGKIENIICSGSGAVGNYPGIDVGSNFQVINCECLNCAFGFFSDTAGNSFAHCLASFCLQSGFSIASSNTTFVDCQSLNNGAFGFYTTAPAARNSFLNCSANNNSLAGFNLAFSGNTVIQSCSAKSNQTGIQASGNCEALNNECANNSSFGFNFAGTGSRVDGNSSINGVGGGGFNVVNTGNLIIRNTSRGGATAFSIPAGNSSGPVVDVNNGGNGTNNITSSAWANFSY